MTSVACIVAVAGVARLRLLAARVPRSCESSYMHRNHWIPADERTKVFRLFGCSLTPQVSHLTPAPGCSLSPIASRLSPASGSLISIESLVGSDGQHTQKDACLGRSSECTFPLGEGRRRAADRLAKMRGRNIGSFALGDTFSWTSL
jgi:hypothetical protein